MGQTASSVGKALVGPPLTWWRGKSGSADGENSLVRNGVTPFIYKRRGSMYFDEDGDLAHEFYCEVTDRRTNKVVMRRCLNNLVPEGDVDLPFPRLNVDFPIIMFDTSSVSFYSQSR